LASIIRKKKKKRWYYYAVQSARVEGKPRIVWQKYLGTLDAIVKRAEGAAPPKPKETVIFEAGAVAALLGIAQRLGLVELIDEAVPKRDQGPSVGQYMVLAALNRAVAPCSKLAIGDWYEETVLRRLWRFPKTAFSSQRFWEHMDMVCEEAIEHVQKEVASRVAREFGLERDVLLYDTTNFFTFLATSNRRGRIAKRGHNKAKRHDLREVGLALLVTREGQVPLFHRVYTGNTADVSLFPELAKELLERHDQLMGSNKEATLVFDKGNICDEAMQRFVGPGRHFVAALPAGQAGELIAAPLEEFQDVAGLPGTKAYGAKHEFWDMECTAAVAYTESFFTQKIKVHGFYCVLALLLATLARNIVAQAGVDMTIPALLKELTAIREVAVIYPQSTLAHRKDHMTLSRMTPRQKKLAGRLQIAQVLEG